MAAFVPLPALFASRMATTRSGRPLATRPTAPGVAPFRRRGTMTPRCTAASPSSPPPAAEAANDETLLKRFLNATPALGRLRLITSNRDTCVMEAIATTDGLFYAVGGPAKAEYANIIDPSINLDLHLKLSGVAGARFETGVSRGGGGGTTYIIRLLGLDEDAVILSLFMQWDKVATDVSEERVAAWKALKEEYCGEGNDTVRFL
ncbi:hypothetical protein MMPV_003973 [Pyropia vietnamensis]